jgi:Fuc2NAc and GlcNAc transferase
MDWMAPGSSLLGFVTAYVVLRVLIARARQMRLVAVPDHRSSHTVPTPTAGGIAFVAPVLVWCGVLAWGSSAWAMAVAGGGLLVASAGLWDDWRGLSAGIRLFAYGAAVALVIVVDNASTATHVLGVPLPALLVSGFTLIALLWLVNLYNFMDGIDGLAATQCLIYCAGILLVGGAAHPPGATLAVLAGAVAAFWWFNRAPAAIFMGDVGSAFLGFVLGAVAFELWREWQITPLVSLILLSPFIIDATGTLVMRALTGQSVTAGHRSHAYQKAAQALGHGRVTWILTGYGVVWLIPLAWVSATYPALAWYALGLAGIPVVLFCLYHNAGR